MKTVIKQIPLVALGIALIAVAINLFLAPHHIAAGGVTGVGILVEEAFGINLALTVLVLNVLKLVLAYIFLERPVFYQTVIGSMMLPLALAVIPHVKVADDTMLSVLFGSGIFGVGVAILYKIGASSGGTTIPPLIFKRYFGLNTAIGLLFTDAVVVFFNIFVSGFQAFLFAILSLVITKIVMSYIEVGWERRRALMIKSEHHIDEIRQCLLENFNRGIVVFSVSSGSTGTEKNMIMIIVNNREYRAVLKKMAEIDEKVSVIVYNVSEVHGLGFSYQTLV